MEIKIDEVQRVTSGVTIGWQVGKTTWARYMFKGSLFQQAKGGPSDELATGPEQYNYDWTDQYLQNMA